VERDAAFASEALDALLRRAKAKGADCALATELALGVLRWRRLLDFLIERLVQRPAESLDLEVLLALRLGIYQQRYLSRVPSSAAVNDSVELVKRARKSSAAGLVNAALRRATRDEMLHKPAEEIIPRERSAAERMALAWSHPTWLVERWLARYGEAETRALLEANNRPPRFTAAFLDPGAQEQVLEAMRQLGSPPEPGRWLKSAVEFRRTETPGPPDGARGAVAMISQARINWLVQDEASQMIPFLLDVHPGDRVLDLCAAPGGKTARLLQQAGAGRGIVIACDMHLHRLRQMREFLNSVSASEARYVALDGTRPLPFGTRFDRILVDAPCSGTGTLARNPEIRWRLRREDLTALAEKQRALLSHALQQLAPGGRLVYSTCSLEPEENEEVMAAALAGRRGIRRISGAAALAPHLSQAADPSSLFDSQGHLRTVPSVHGTDGFFAACMAAG
jgi:16S rRNA (cytosine967-C5)-methyltransferase